MGISSFGPVDLTPDSPTWGHITSTPKAAWRNFDLAGAIGKGLGVPVRFDTDVNAAVLGEARWVRTGHCGVSLPHNQHGDRRRRDCIRRLLHGLSPPGNGPRPHSARSCGRSVPRRVPVSQGLPGGTCIRPRDPGAMGRQAGGTCDDHPGWVLEAKYLAYGIANYVCTLSPERILVGGGVMRQAELYSTRNSNACWPVMFRKYPRWFPRSWAVLQACWERSHWRWRRAD